VPTMWTLAILSFFFSLILIRVNAVAAVYSAASRAWELLAGALLALGAFPAARWLWLRELLGVSGLVMVLVSVVEYTTATPFPGVAAVLPAGGAALIIYSGEARTTFVSRLLGAKIPVAIGLISYSLYLWHWPIIIMTQYFLAHDLTKLQKAAVLVASFLAAYMSWRHVERPFRRHGATRLSQPLVFRLTAATSLVFLAAGVVFAGMHGFPSRFKTRVSLRSAVAGPFATAGSAHPACGIERRHMSELCTVASRGSGY
jgi:peptidoglycan/LPS O-acetylase OafA/YrhL